MIGLAVECHDAGANGAAFTESADLTVLDEGARRAVEVQLGRGFIYLQLYLFEDQEHVLVDQGMPGLTLQDVESNPALAARFWGSFVRWFAQRSGPHVVFLNDVLWDATHGWQDVAIVAASGQLGSNLNLQPTARPGVFAASATASALQELVGNWWPSRAGGLAGISLIRGRNGDLLHEVSATACLRATDIERVSVVFEASKQFENLGLDLLVRAEDCRSVLDELASFGMTQSRRT